MVDGQVVVRRPRGVRVVARLLRHAEDRARVRVHDDRRRVLRMPLLHGLREHLLGVRLDLAVEREEDVAALMRRTLLDRVHRLAERVPHLDRASRLPRQLPVQLELEAREPRVVEAREPEHRGRDGALRIDALLVGRKGEADEVAFLELGRELRRRFPLDVDEAEAVVGELLVDRPELEPEYLRRDLRLPARRSNLQRIGVDVRRLLPDRERVAQPVVDRPSPGRQHDRLLRLCLRHRRERRRAHRLEPGGARTECREREEDDEQEKAQPRVDDAGLQRPRCSTSE